MEQVAIGASADEIAQRQRLGIDNYDEVWEGVYHAVRPPTVEHQRIAVELIFVLLPCAERAGLRVLHFNVCPAGDPVWHDVRVPDLVVFDLAVAEEHAVTGPAAAVIEIYEPGDESLEKLPFYERLDVGEVLIIDRDTKVVRRWVNGPNGLVESPGDGVGRHALGCLPVEVWNEGETLVVFAEGVRTEI